jgi:uncharacterized protein (DUF885 family)
LEAAVKITYLVAAGLTAATLASTAAQNEPDAAAATTTLADEFVAMSVQRFPEMSMFLGAADAPRDRVFDNTLEAKRDWDRRVDAMQTPFRAIDRSALAGRPELVTYGYLQQALASETDRRVCRAELWAVDHLGGWQVSLPAVLSRQPVATEAERKAALDRIGQYGRFVDREIEVLRSGLSSGYVAPRVNVERVIGQIEGLLAETPDKSPFMSITGGSKDAAFTGAVAGVIAKQLNPALTRYKNFLDEYRGVARTNAGVSEIPQGEACYRASSRTTPRSISPPTRCTSSG